MIFRTECAWCGVFMHEKKCSDTKHCLNLAKGGIITSHGICKKCKKIVEIGYKSKLGEKKRKSVSANNFISI